MFHWPPRIPNCILKLWECWSRKQRPAREGDKTKRFWGQFASLGDWQRRKTFPLKWPRCWRWSLERRSWSGGGQRLTWPKVVHFVCTASKNRAKARSLQKRSLFRTCAGIYALIQNNASQSYYNAIFHLHLALLLMYRGQACLRREKRLCLDC